MRKTLHTFEYLILSIILFTAFTFNVLQAAEEDAKALKFQLMRIIMIKVW